MSHELLELIGSLETHTSALAFGWQIAKVLTALAKLG